MVIDLQKAGRALLPDEQEGVDQLPKLAHVEKQTPEAEALFPQCIFAVRALKAVIVDVARGDVPDVDRGPERVGTKKDVVDEGEGLEGKRLARGGGGLAGALEEGLGDEVDDDSERGEKGLENERTIR